MDKGLIFFAPYMPYFVHASLKYYLNNGLKNQINNWTEMPISNEDQNDFCKSSVDLVFKPAHS